MRHIPFRTIAPLPALEEVRVTIELSHGTVWAKLYADRAPQTVANFVHLAQGTHPWKNAEGHTIESQPYYDGKRVHRVVPGFIVQAGCVRGDGLGNPGYRFADELNVRHDRAGLLSMANAGRDTNGAQFFVTLRPAPELDRKHAVFGEVVHGIEVFEAISRSPLIGERPADDVFIERVSIELIGA
ncbi:MAG TPA: peptidylprolyl isomerase [Myxococcales bacterium]|nr:peptidylprolyl isomerase [Myxococcales bacterium]